MDLKDRKRPTLKTLSKVTGFAVTTVSRALRNEPEININTRTKIQKAASELGYQPDRAAQRLRTGRSLSIGLIFDQRYEVAGYERQILAGLSSVLYGETPHSLVVFSQPAEMMPIEAVRLLVDNAQVDGLVFSNTTPQDERVRYLLDRNLPFVTLGRSDFQVPHAFLDFDNRRFVELSVERLFAKGRRKIAFVRSGSNLTCAPDLMNAYVDTTTRLRLPPNVIPDLVLGSDLSAFCEAATRMAASADRPDGIVCANELGAIAMASGFVNAGITPGTDIDLIAASTSDLLDYVSPKIDSYHQDLVEAGRTLARILIRQLDDEPITSLQFVTEPVLRDRTGKQ